MAQRKKKGFLAIKLELFDLSKNDTKVIPNLQWSREGGDSFSINNG